MKKILLIGLAAVFAACSSDVPGGGLVWGSDTLSRSGANDVVALSYPVVRQGAAADSINCAVNDYLKGTFSDDSLTAGRSTLSEVVDSLLARKNRDTTTAWMPYQLQSEGSHYTRGYLTSVWIETYAFTGGAHGLGLGKAFNFDNRTGEQLSVEQLFKDTTRLSGINREAFLQMVKQRGVTQEDASLYLFVKPDALPLPENIGFDSTGVKMFYNPYEIAAYVFGQSVYTIPYDQAEPVLRRIARGK